MRAEQVLSSGAGCSEPHAIPAPPERSIHTRPLPDGLVALSSKQGRRRFSESLSGGTAEAYFPLAEQFVTQSEVTFCGLASLTMCMNALRVDPMRIWKVSSRHPLRRAPPLSAAAFY